MDAQLVDAFRHQHVFLGEAHDRNARKTRFVIAICTIMMVAEIVGGIWFGSVALIADGLHMSTHAGAMLIAALAYAYSRSHVGDPRFSFGTDDRDDTQTPPSNHRPLIHPITTSAVNTTATTSNPHAIHK